LAWCDGFERAVAATRFAYFFAHFVVLTVTLVHPISLLRHRRGARRTPRSPLKTLIYRADPRCSEVWTSRYRAMVPEFLVRIETGKGGSTLRRDLGAGAKLPLP